MSSVIPTVVAPIAERRILTPAEYEAWVAPPPPIPTQNELLDMQIALWTGGGFATETELRQFAQFVPERDPFCIFPEFGEPNDLTRMMAMVVLNGKTGINHLDVSAIANIVTVPKGPYIMLGMNDGRDSLNVRPIDSRKTIEKAGGNPFIGSEVIAFGAVFPVVLEHHNLWGAGSRCGQRFVPLLYVCDRRPAFRGGFEDARDPGWGSPWCRERKGLRP